MPRAKRPAAYRAGKQAAVDGRDAITNPHHPVLDMENCCLWHEGWWDYQQGLTRGGTDVIRPVPWEQPEVEQEDAFTVNYTNDGSHMGQKWGFLAGRTDGWRQCAREWGEDWYIRQDMQDEELPEEVE